MDKRTFEKLRAYMQSCMHDSAHDAEHIRRVLNHALVIAEDEAGVDYDVLICACLLHDIGREKQLQDPSVCHAAAGSEMAYSYLLSQGCTEDFAQRVRDCIRTHRFRKSDPPESLEAKILFDADKLDVVGAMGIARTLVYKGTVSEPLYSRGDDGKVSDGSTQEPQSFFREYHYKLKNLYSRFYTQKGAQLAESRRAAAEAFYDALYREVTSFDARAEAQLQKIIAP